MIRHNCIRASAVFTALMGVARLLSAANEPFPIPEWVSPFPEGREHQMTNSTVSADASYTALASPARVVEHYEQQLQNAGITFQTNFDGIGTTIRASLGRTSCVIRATESESATGVTVSCARQLESTEAPVTRPLLAPVEPPLPPPVPKQAAGVPGKESTGSCMVDYEVNGSARAVSVTYRNQSGGTDQKSLSPPYKNSFLASPGSELYLSAQKVRVNPSAQNAPVDLGDPRSVARRNSFVDGISGAVHVAIRVNSTLAEEATTSAPYGIATAKGSCPKGATP